MDTGLASLNDAFMQNLRSLIPLEDLRWLWLTHTDADHTGSIRQILNEAPNARLVTTFLGMGKLGLQQIQVPMDRVYLLNPGQSLDLGDRSLTAVKPPTFDAPETTGFYDTKTKVLFIADCFGALMKEPAESAADIAPSDLHDGLVEQAVCRRDPKERAHRGAARRLAEHGHVVRITVEARNVVLHPLQGAHLIVHPVVARQAIGIARQASGGREEAQRAKRT